MKRARILLAGIAFFTFILSRDNLAVQTRAQSTHCGNGLLWQFRVGDVGWIIPTQSAIDVFEIPGSNPISIIEPGELFVVVGGPECTPDGLSWWPIVNQSNELLYHPGWIAEGTDSRYFDEPVFKPVDKEIYGSNCENAETPRLTVGQYAKVAHPEELQPYFGHPAIEGSLVQLPPQLIQPFSASEELLVLEGPVCFGGHFMWRVGGGNEVVDAEVAVPLVSISLPFPWLFEAAQGQYLLEPSTRQPEIGDAHTPPTLSLRASAPIVDAMGQTKFATGAGGLGAFNAAFELWTFDDTWYCTLLDESTTTVTFPRDVTTCVALYPLPDNVDIEVTLRQPDGTIYSADRIVGTSIPIKEISRAGIYLEYRENANPTGVVIEVPDMPGLMSGVWTIEARYEGGTLSKAYELEHDTRQKIFTTCDGFKPVLAFNGFSPSELIDLVMVELVEEEGGLELQRIYTEKHRWPVEPGTMGDLLAYVGVPSPTAVGQDFFLCDHYYTTTKPGGSWDRQIKYEEVLEGALIVDTYWSCPAPPTETAARDGLLHYGDLVTGSLVKKLYSYDYPIDQENFKLDPFRYKSNYSCHSQLLYESYREQNSQVFYAFEGASGDRITINLIAQLPVYDPLLQLLDPNRTLIAENDDAENPHYGNLDAEISGFELPHDGIYTIVVKEVQGAGLVYTLTLDRSDETHFPMPSQTPSVVVDDFACSGSTNTSGNTLLFRNFPSSEAQILAEFPNQTQVVIIGRDTSGAFWQVQQWNITGWVSADYILADSTCTNAPIISNPKTTNELPSAPPGVQMEGTDPKFSTGSFVVATENARIWSDPDTSVPNASGDPISIGIQLQIASVGIPGPILRDGSVWGYWYLVRYPDDPLVAGWIWAERLQSR